MLKIGVTQRAEVISSYGETRDCLDQQWAGFLDSINCLCIPLPNFPSSCHSLLNSLSLDGIILSGGNNIAINPDTEGSSPKRDEFESSTLTWAKQKNIPVIGVCRGMQFINFYLGGSLSSISNHVNSRHSLNPNNKSFLLDNISEVNSFHNSAILESDLSNNLEILATANDQSIEAFKHKNLPWLGIMWHPEREKPYRQTELTLFDAFFNNKIEF